MVHSIRNRRIAVFLLSPKPNQDYVSPAKTAVELVRFTQVSLSIFELKWSLLNKNIVYPSRDNFEWAHKFADQNRTHKLFATTKSIFHWSQYTKSIDTHIRTGYTDYIYNFILYTAFSSLSPIKGMDGMNMIEVCQCLMVMVKIHTKIN